MLLLLTLLGCTSSSGTTLEICEVQLAQIVPTAALPGDPAVVTGAPLTTHYDTALFIDGVRAEVTEVVREGCEECDTCREDAVCGVCGDCDDCDALCDADCVETATFLVPQLPAGPSSVQLFNTHGGSNTLSLEIIAAGDTAETGDTATEDTGRRRTFDLP